MPAARQHPMLEAVSAWGQEEDGRWMHSLVGHSTTWGGVTRLELIEALAMEERKRVQMEENGGGITARVEQAALVSMLASAVRNFTVTVSAYAVVSTYDPTKTFKPGQQTIWSGHTSEEEALRIMPLWQQHLAHPQRTDTFHVDYRAVPISYMRKTGWAGPGPRRSR